MDANKMPSGFDSFQEAQKEKFIELKKLKEEGKRVVGTYCSFVPKEIIYAADAIPLSLCASSESSIAAAERHLPKNLCPLIKSSYGHAVSDSCPFFYFSDFIIGETTCDGKKKMFELMNDIKPTHVMQLPQSGLGEENLNFWIKEVIKLKEFLEENYHIKISEDDVKREIKKSNEERRVLIEFCELSALNPCPISGLEQFNVIETFGFHYDREKRKEEVERKTKDIKDFWDRELRGKKDERPRLLLTGCPMGGVKEKILKNIEDAGAVIVAFDSCSGLRSLMNFIDEKKDPIFSTAKKYLETNCSVMSPNKGRLKDIAYLAEKFSADALVEVTLLACHTFNIESHSVKKLAGELKLPYFHIESDYSSQDEGQIKTRIEALVEMLTERKRNN